MRVTSSSPSCSDDVDRRKEEGRRPISGRVLYNAVHCARGREEGEREMDVAEKAEAGRESKGESYEYAPERSSFAFRNEHDFAQGHSKVDSSSNSSTR